jgi:hypothetical protein
MIDLQLLCTIEVRAARLDSMLVQRDSYVHQVRLDPVFDFVRGEPGCREWEVQSGLPRVPASRVAPDSGTPRPLAPLMELTVS